jgi:Holliday junction resolvasome RuvABC endonuclease subunit
MMAASKVPHLTLGLHPTARGFGWVMFEGPFTPHDWGVSNATNRRGDKNEYCLNRVEKLLARHGPETLVLEEFDSHTSKRQQRVVRLCQAIVCLAVDRGIEVSVYRRGDVRACFAGVGARTRDEIAAAVARHFDALRPRLPSSRRAWKSEGLAMALFSAAAIVLTHYQLGGPSLFDGLNL